ncbi:MAG: hypothetical protein PHW15_01860 [Patescibacteria group bacterium]|jgi:hypothetical protein|nr:hypothetical protein [Patescibacteria group bacterium]MDD5172794.1 hypothetical protein [Patescibacteria group bacterium]
MRKKIFILIILLFLPLIVQAQTSDLSIRTIKWRESFGKRDIEKIILNKEYFFLNESEANYLFKSEIEKFKNSLVKNSRIVFTDGFFHFQTIFTRTLKGKIYVFARPLEHKIGIDVLRAEYYGFKIPARWAEKIINNELDKYFSFLYQAKNYQSARLVVKDKAARLVIEFK